MNTFGRNFRLSLWGESHGSLLGITLDGVSAGIPLSAEEFEADLARRRSGAAGTTPRREKDTPRIVSGLYRGHTTGAPLTLLFDNTDTRSADYPAALLDTWRAFEQLLADGRVRAIGVCNCLKEHLNVLFDACKVAPMVNQIEYHFGFRDPDQEEAVRYSRERGMVVEAWAPLCRGKAFGDPDLVSVAKKHGKTEAQVLVRWCLQRGTLPLPKSATPARIRENADIFDFALDAADMALLSASDKIGRLGPHPTEARF